MFDFRSLTETYVKLSEKRVGKTYQISVPETDVRMMKKYLKDAQHSYEMGTSGNKAVFEISLLDKDELDELRSDLKSLRIRHTVGK